MITMTSIDVSTPVLSSTPEGLTPVTVSPEAVDGFTASMTQPIQDNVAAQTDFVRAMQAFMASAESISPRPQTDDPVVKSAVVPSNAPRTDSQFQTEINHTSTRDSSVVQGSVPTNQGSVPTNQGSVPTNQGSVPADLRSVPTTTPSTTSDLQSSDLQPQIEVNRPLSRDSYAVKGSVPTDQGSVPTVSVHSAPVAFKAEEPDPNLQISGSVPVVSVPIQGSVPMVESTDGGVEAVTARTIETVAHVERVMSASEVIVAAATEVADTLLVTPGLMNGDGEVIIRLKPEVLDGSEIRINVTGRQLGVEFMPIQANTAAFIERHLPQLQEALVARVHSYTVGVSVRRGKGERA